MKRFRSLILFPFYLRRIAQSLDKIARLYEIDCREHGVILVDPKLKDETEISYEVKRPEKPEEEPEWNL